METLKMKKLRPDAVIPKRATAGSAGLDLAACMDAPVTIAPGDLAMIPTGLAVAIPENTVGLIFSRSGLGVKHGITLSNSVGVIDSDYRGELRIGVCNVGSEPYEIAPGERIAQLVVTPILTLPVEETCDLGETARGEGGFGSTGKT